MLSLASRRFTHLRALTVVCCAAQGEEGAEGKPEEGEAAERGSSTSPGRSPSPKGFPGLGKGISETVESCIVVLTAIAMGGVLYILGEVLVPLILSVFISSMLVPLIDLLTDRPVRLFNRTWCNRFWCDPALKIEERWDNWVMRQVTSVLTLRLPNVLALLMVLGALASGLAFTGVVLYRSVEPFIDHAHMYEKTALTYAEEIYSAGGHFFHVNNQTSLNQYVAQQTQSVKDDSGQRAQDLLTADTFRTITIEVLESIAGSVGTAALIMMYVIFILLGRQKRQERKGRKVTYVRPPTPRPFSDDSCGLMHVRHGGRPSSTSSRCMSRGSF